MPGFLQRTLSALVSVNTDPVTAYSYNDIIWTKPQKEVGVKGGIEECKKGELDGLINKIIVATLGFFRNGKVCYK